MSGGLLTRPLLSPEETKFAEQIRRELQEIGYRGKLIFKTQPTAFIKPDWVAKSDERRDALFQGIITFALIDRPTKGKIALAVVDATTHFAQEVQSLLSEFDIPVFTSTIEGNFSTFKDWLHLVLGRKNPRTPTKSIVNLSERWLLTISDRSLLRQIDPKKMISLPHEVADIVKNVCAERRAKFQLFHELALSAILAANKATCGNAGVDYEYLQTLRFDLLVTSTSPKYVPLMAIEFDGPEHEKEAGKLRDAKKEQILVAADIPLLRISYHDAPPPEGGADFSAHISSAQKQSILSGLIKRSVDLLHRERVDVPAQLQRVLGAVGSRYHASISETRKKTASIHVAEYDPVHIEEVTRQVLDALDKFNLDEGADRFADFQMRELELDPRQDASLKSNGTTLSRFQYHTDKYGAIYCSVRVSRGHEDRVVKNGVTRKTGSDTISPLRHQLKNGN